MRLFVLLCSLSLYTACEMTTSPKDDQNQQPADPANEGSAAQPVVLEVGETHQVKLGTLPAGEDESFYQFTPGVSGDYTFTGSNFSGEATGFTLKVLLGTTFEFDEFPIATQAYTTSLTAENLEAGQVYGLRFLNLYDSDYKVTFDFLIQGPL